MSMNFYTPPGPEEAFVFQAFHYADEWLCWPQLSKSILISLKHHDTVIFVCAYVHGPQTNYSESNLLYNKYFGLNYLFGLTHYKQTLEMIIACILLRNSCWTLTSIMKEMLYEVRYLKSSEDMILPLTGQFKQLFMRQKLLKLSSKCEDHIFSWFQILHLIQHFFHTTFLSRENMSPTNWPALNCGRYFLQVAGCRLQVEISL